jgi:hypothetical protein
MGTNLAKAGMKEGKMNMRNLKKASMVTSGRIKKGRAGAMKDLESVRRAKL